MTLIIPTGLTATYRGRPGCGCGCRGRYAYLTADAAPEYARAEWKPTPRQVQNDLRDVADALAAGVELCSTVPGIAVVEYADGETIVSYETETRALWLYFADAASARRFVDANRPDPIPAGATPVQSACRAAGCLNPAH